MKRSAFVLFSTMAAVGMAADGGMIFYPDTAGIGPWIGPKSKDNYTPIERKFVLKSKSDRAWVVDGFRITIPNAPGKIQKSYADSDFFQSANRMDATDVLTGPDRWEFRIGGGNNLNTFQPGQTKTLPFMAFNVTASNWTPQYPHHWLTKTGSFATNKGFIDAPAVKVAELGTILDNQKFYDPSVFVRDSMGQRGGKYSGGFIDTWMDQQTLIPVTQFQINFLRKADYIQMNGEYCKFRPDLMGVNTSDGAGPMYAMSLAMVQEYFHLDWQMFAAMGSHESMAGLELYENLGAKPGKVVGVKFGKASGFGGNNDEQLGTMHYLTPSYKAYAYQSYPEFFPYDQLGGNPAEFFKTPDPESKGTTTLGWCAGNSATIASVTLINSLYCWWGFDVMYNATSFDYRKMNDGAKDYEWAAKMFMSAWNGGWGKLNADATTLFGVPEDPAKVAAFKADTDVSDNVAQTIYVKKVYNTVPLLTGANKNSVLNGGECAVYDTTISLEKVAEFFFGINKDWDGNTLGTSLELAESGKLGKQGVLNHFRLKDEKRLQLWNDVKTAYNMMKNRAPSSKGTDMISLRYDFLTLLRVAKQYLILEMPIPVHSEFKTKVAELSKVNNIVDADPTDNVYPLFKVDYSNFGFDAQGNFFIELDAKDNGAFDVNPGKPIEWTVDEYWNDWREGETMKIESAADKSNTGRFRVVIPHSVYKEEFGTKRVGYGWARVSDKNRNSTIQEFVIPAIKYPRFRKAYAKDRNGDGVGDSLIVELIPAEDKEKFYAIDAFDSIAYSWPDKTPIKNKKDVENLIKSDSSIALVDSKLTGGTGEGFIFGRYPLDIAEYKIDSISSTFTGVISDSVGPAIRTAVLTIDPKRAKDTLVCAVSEPIVLKLDGTDPYVILKNGTSEEAIAADLIEKVSDTEYKFIFDKSKNATDKEMVKFVFTGTTVVDAKGNRPIAINQWVPIVQKGDKDASVELAQIFDRNGDGYGDSVLVQFKLGSDAKTRYTTDSIVSTEYSWPSNSQFDLADLTQITKLNESSLSFTGIKNLAGFGEGALKFSFPESKVVPGSILDRVGPALRESATCNYSDESRKADTVNVTLTEMIDLTKITSGESYFEFAEDTTKTIDALATLAIRAGSIDAVTAEFAKDGIKKSYKWIRLKSSNGVVDSKGNRPAGNSKWVPLAVFGKKEASFDRAEMRDRDGDGYGDSVHVTLKLGNDANRFTAKSIAGGVYSWPENNQFEILAASEFKSVTDETFSFTAIKNRSGFGEGAIALGIAGTDSIRGTIVDLVGPALRDSAKFDNSNGDRLADTLMLNVTEMIDSTALQNDVFYFHVAVDTANAESIKSQSVRVISADSVVATVAKGDLDKKAYGWIRLSSENGVKDLNGNVPHHSSKWVKIVRTGTESAIRSAAIFDTKGNGRGNEIRITFADGSSPKAPKLAELKAVAYTWPASGSEDSAKSADWTISNGTVIFATKGDRDGFGIGGVAKLIFADTSFTATILDSVGPAITKAARLWSENSENDTVVVAVSEKIKNEFRNDTAYAVIVRGTTATAIKSKVTTFENDSLKFVFPFGSIQERDSIALIRTAGVVDLVGNVPHDKNQRVEIELIGGKKPSFVSGFMFDQNGDGFADSAVVTVRKGSHKDADKTADLISSKLSWPSRTDLLPAQGSALDETTIKLTGMNTFATEGNGSVELTFPSGLVAGTVADRVGPVIVSAKLWEPMGGNDTLQIEFSEPIVGAGNTMELINVNGSAKLSLKAEPYLNEKIWRFIFTGKTIALGDSVTIRFGSSITDTVNGVHNPAHENNRKVEVVLKQRPINLVQSESGFFDTNADGVMDQMKIKLAKDVDAKRIERFTVTTTWPNTSGVVDSIHVTSRDMTVSAGILAVDLAEKSIASGTTSVDETRYGTIVVLQPDDDQVVPHSTTFVGNDFMAPVLVNSARYMGKKLTSDEEQFEDELVLNYSEPIGTIDIGSGSDLDVYTLTGPKKGSYSIGMTGKSIHEGSKVTQKVRVIRNQSEIPAAGDSIAIKANSQGKVVDLKGNVQREQSAYVPFTTVYLPAEYAVSIYPNPFTIGSDKKNELLMEYGDRGDYSGLMGVVVRPYGNRVGENLSGVISIFDAVGHVIVDREPLVYQESGVLLVALDGTNQRGREVGSGMYRGIIEVTSGTDDEKQVNVIPVMIGIQHSK